MSHEIIKADALNRLNPKETIPQTDHLWDVLYPPFKRLASFGIDDEITVPPELSRDHLIGLFHVSFQRDGFRKMWDKHVSEDPINTRGFHGENFGSMRRSAEFDRNGMLIDIHDGTTRITVGYHDELPHAESVQYTIKTKGEIQQYSLTLYQDSHAVHAERSTYGPNPTFMKFTGVIYDDDPQATEVSFDRMRTP